MEGKIVYQGKIKNGTQITIRYPLITDAKDMTEFMNTLSEERTFMAYQGDKFYIKNETDFLLSQLEKIKNKKALLLFVYADNKFAGISNAEMGILTEKHIGNLGGISIDKNLRGNGIGKLLMKHMLEESVENLKDLEILILGVFSNNSLAIISPNLR